jgi:hypothetical protein
VYPIPKDIKNLVVDLVGAHDDRKITDWGPLKDVHPVARYRDDDQPVGDWSDLVQVTARP